MMMMMIIINLPQVPCILQWEVLISSPETGQKQLANGKHVLETFAHFFTRKSFYNEISSATFLRLFWSILTQVIKNLLIS